MKLNLPLLLLSTALAAGSASAVSYDASTNGYTATPGATFVGLNGNPTLYTFADTTVLGIDGVGASSEIDPWEALFVSFSKAVYVKSLTIGLLYDGLNGEFNDPNEVAWIVAGGGASRVEATSDTTASILGSGTVTNVVPADGEEHGAVWKITNPFGKIKVNLFYLTPSFISEPGKDTSDFGLVAYQTPDVVSTLSLAGASLLGLGFLARRRR